ncbi:MAG: hypothetical protein KDE53_04420 [Caldilineaceae bacterium]|nr:hypothetical protein [Caldilineaceae bacterium]
MATRRKCATILCINNFYKCSPHPISWSARYYAADAYEGLTERQRAILEAPNARYRNR